MPTDEHDDLKRQPHFAAGCHRNRCIGCGQSPLVLVQSKYVQGWGICEECASKAAGIFKANADVIETHKTENA